MKTFRKSTLLIVAFCFIFIVFFSSCLKQRAKAQLVVLSKQLNEQGVKMDYGMEFIGSEVTGDTLCLKYLIDDSCDVVIDSMIAYPEIMKEKYLMVITEEEMHDKGDMLSIVQKNTEESDFQAFVDVLRDAEATLCISMTPKIDKSKTFNMSFNVNDIEAASILYKNPDERLKVWINSANKLERKPIDDFLKDSYVEIDDENVTLTFYVVDNGGVIQNMKLNSNDVEGYADELITGLDDDTDIPKLCQLTHRGIIVEYVNYKTGEKADFTVTPEQISRVVDENTTANKILRNSMIDQNSLE